MHPKVTGPYSGRLADNAPDCTQEPSMLAKAEELLKHVTALEQEHSRLRENLLGPYPVVDGLGAPEQASLFQMIYSACERVACLVGDAATLNGRIG